MFCIEGVSQMAEKAYLQVYHRLKEQIEHGAYPVGALLPTEASLQQEFAVSRTTVRKAVSLLVADGYIHVQQGRGTEVVSGVPAPHYYKFHNVTGIQEIFPAVDKPITMRSMYIDRAPANAETAKALEVAPETEVFRIQRILSIDGKPFALMKNYVRTDVAPGLDHYQAQLRDLYSFLEQQYGVTFASGCEHISAAAAGFVESQLLEVDPGAPLLLCTRYAHAERCPLEFAKTYLRPDRYDLVVQMQGWPAQGVTPMPTMLEHLENE